VRYDKTCNFLHVKYPLFLSDLNATWVFSTDFRKNTQISNCMNTHPGGAELFFSDRRTDGRTDMKLIIAFRKFAKTTKNEESHLFIVCTMYLCLYCFSVCALSCLYYFDNGLIDLNAGRLARSQNPEGPATGHP
jgi:hypothetical protein